ncbi:MAG: amidohydrolase [Spirochaetia bacterium]|jgi:amidohydrolase|nr:amidohydrolase [Spirochaetia bacterium]
MNRKKSSEKITKDDLFTLAGGIADEIIGIRHTIHANPEVMFKEYETAALIRGYLDRPGIKILKPYLETDTTAVIKGNRAGPGRTVLLRADIDALRLEEKTELPWKSTKEGAAHSCGHDGHTAILLGAAKILSTLTDYFSGNIKLVFQPAEESGGGGKILVEKGVLDDEPYVDEVYALHGWPGVEEGFFESVSGAMMAAVDNFEIEVSARGGHAAMPHHATDAVLTAAQIVTALQGIVSRNVDPNDAAVVSVCTIHGGELNNVLPDSVKMKGTVRYFKKKMQSFFKDRIGQIVNGVCSANMATGNLKYTPGYIPLVNSSDKVRFAGEVIKNFFGEDKWSDSAIPTGGGEDFSFYLDKRPGAFYRLGLGKNHPSLHNSRFDFNDNVIVNGIVSMCAIALCSLEDSLFDL